MTVGFGVLLAAIGAILYWAVTASVAGVSLNAVGVILMVAGGIAILVGLFRDVAWFEGMRRDRRVEDERYQRGAGPA